MTPEATVPSTAECRAFFAEHGTQHSLKDDLATPSLIAPPALLLPPDSLFHACQLLATGNNAFAEILRMCLHPADIADDLTTAGHSIQMAFDSKLHLIQRMLMRPPRVDWKPIRLSIAEQYPLCLIDRLLDLLAVISGTAGLWTLTEAEASNMAAEMDALVVQLAEFQHRLARRIVPRPTKDEEQRHAVATSDTETIITPDDIALDMPPTAEMVAAVGLLATYLSFALRTSLESSSSLLGSGEVGYPDPLIAAISAVPTPVPRTHVTTPCEETAGATLPETFGGFMEAVIVLNTSPVATELLASSDMHDVIGALQGVRSGLHEFAKQRAFEWSSALGQWRLPHYATPFPTAVVLDSASTTPAATPTSSGGHSGTTSPSEIRRDQQSPPSSSFFPELRLEDKSSSANSASLENVQNFIRYKLGCLSHALSGVYKSLGAVLGGVYGNPGVQQELVTATVLGMYVWLVGFLFIDDLHDLAQWMEPMLPSIRRRIRQQTAPVNVSMEPNHPPAGSTVQTEDSKNGCFTDKPLVTKRVCTSASCASPAGKEAVEGLLPLLMEPGRLALSRTTESDAVVSFFLPQLKQRGAAPAPVGRTVAPTTESEALNRLLIWLAWEGDLLQLYSRIATTSSDAEKDDEEEATAERIEEAIVTAIGAGCNAVRLRLMEATDLFVVPDNVPTESQQQLVWSGRADNVFDFCYRAMESLMLRHLGEIDLRYPLPRGLQNPDAVGRWKLPLLSCLGQHVVIPALRPGETHCMATVVETLPKLLGEFTHQTLFYRCPVASVSEALPDVVGVAASVASANASASRLGGLVADFDTRLVAAQHLGEAAVLNSHANRQACLQLEERLVELRTQFQAHVDGVSERHSNQIRGHSDRLEENQKGIRRNAATIATQQTILSRLSEDVKEMLASTTGLRHRVDRARSSLVVEPSETETSETEQLVSKAEARLRLRLDTLETELRSLEKNVQAYTDEYRTHTSHVEILVKSLTRRIEDTLQNCSEDILDRKIQETAAALTESELDRRIGQAMSAVEEATRRHVDEVIDRHRQEVAATVAQTAAAPGVAASPAPAPEETTASLPWQTMEAEDMPESELPVAPAAPSDVFCPEPCRPPPTTAHVESTNTEEAPVVVVAARGIGRTQEARVTDGQRRPTVIVRCDKTASSPVQKMIHETATTIATEKVEEAEAAWSSHLETNRATTAAALKELREDVNELQSGLARLQTALEQQRRGFVDAVLDRTRRELSTYLAESLSHCVSAHVLYHLEQQQQPAQQQRQRRLLAWPTQSSCVPRPTPPPYGHSENDADETNKTPHAPAVHASSPRRSQLAPLIRSTQRLPGITTADFDGVADTISVMEEDSIFPEGFEETWFPHDVVFLKLPTAAAAAGVSEKTPQTDSDKTATTTTSISARYTTASPHSAKRLSEMHGFTHTRRIN